MKKILLSTLVTLVITSCMSVEIGDDVELLKYLQSKNFQHFERKTNVTSFLQFSENEVKLLVYLREKEQAERSYDYRLGDAGEDERQITVLDNEGEWKVKDDGNIYLWHKGELYIYTPFGED